MSLRFKLQWTVTLDTCMCSSFSNFTCMCNSKFHRNNCNLVLSYMIKFMTGLLYKHVENVNNLFLYYFESTETNTLHVHFC